MVYLTVADFSAFFAPCVNYGGFSLSFSLSLMDRTVSTFITKSCNLEKLPLKAGSQQRVVGGGLSYI
jgi:hypothetical protein